MRYNVSILLSGVLRVECTLYGNKVNVYDHINAIEHIKRLIKSNTIKGHKLNQLNTIITFDIETTLVDNLNDGKYEKFNYCYIWQMCIDGVLYIGRHIDEFFYFLDEISTLLEDSNTRVLIFIHNSSYEFNNLAEYFYRGFTSTDDVLMQSSIRPIFFRYKKFIEFRCTYLLTHKSLSMLSKEVGLNKSGDLDYNKPRHSDTNLTDDEYEYCLRDVYNLYKWLYKERDEYSKSIGKTSNIFNIPLTQTGYVRRDIRQYYSNTAKGKAMLRESTLTRDEFDLFHRAFWGGDTHANPQYIGELVKGVKHRDFTSAYPSAMVMEQFPYGKINHGKAGVKNYANYISCDFAVISTLTLKNVRLKKSMCPYIPTSKVDLFDKESVIENNRIVNSKLIVLTICEVDFAIISSIYDFELIDSYNTMYCKKRRLPIEVVNVLLKYFFSKTELKGVDGAEYEYNLSKQKLNGIYGCTAQSLIHDLYTFFEDYSIEVKEDEFKPSSVMPYQWAVYITAYVRLRLNAFKIALGDNFVYCDTDSIFYITNPDVERIFTNYNADVECTLNSMNNDIKCIPTTVKGVRQYLFYFSEEEHFDEKNTPVNTIEFITIGAKRYIVKANNRIDVTVSGLSYSKWSNGCKGANVKLLEDKYHADIIDIFKQMSLGKTFILPYTEKYGDLIHYNQRGDFKGVIYDGVTSSIVYAKSSLVLLPIEKEYAVESSLFQYITTLNKSMLLTSY